MADRHLWQCGIWLRWLCVLVEQFSSRHRLRLFVGLEGGSKVITSVISCNIVDNYHQGLLLIFSLKQFRQNWERIFYTLLSFRDLWRKSPWWVSLEFLMIFITHFSPGRVKIHLWCADFFFKRLVKGGDRLRETLNAGHWVAKIAFVLLATQDRLLVLSFVLLVLRRQLYFNIGKSHSKDPPNQAYRVLWGTSRISNKSQYTKHGFVVWIALSRIMRTIVCD